MTEKAPASPPASILGRLDTLEGRTRRRPPKKRSTGDQIAAALQAARRTRAAESGQDPALADFREDLFGELRKLIRPAIQQAKKGKPALLRILTRYSR